MMYPYKAGDIVRVYHYPYVSKAEKEKFMKEGAEIQHSLFSKGKKRYGVVIGSGGKGILAVPIVQIMSHKGKTEEKGYRLRDDEVRVPEDTYYSTKNGEDVSLSGVIKMERIEMFGAEEMTAPLTQVPLRVKIELLERYEAILKKHYYKSKLDKDSPKHVQVMKEFKESIIAEKLNFLTDAEGENHFEQLKNVNLTIETLQKVGKLNNLNIYSVRLKGRYDTFTYNIATRKKAEQLAKDWDKPKVASQWLKEDVKYHALVSHIDQRIRADPYPHPDKYITFEHFKKQTLKKRKANELDR